MAFYKLILDHRVVRSINLRNVSHVHQDFHKITFTYNHNKTNGFIFFGSGLMNHEPNEETFKFQTASDASQIMAGIEKAMEKL